MARGNNSPAKPTAKYELNAQRKHESSKGLKSDECDSTAKKLINLYILRCGRRESFVTPLIIARQIENIPLLKRVKTLTRVRWKGSNEIKRVKLTSPGGFTAVKKGLIEQSIGYYRLPDY